MEPIKEKECSFEEKLYPSGHELRFGKQTRICINGEWVKPTEVRIPGILVE